MAGNTPLTFTIYKGGEFLREETLTQPVIKVGKLASSHLRLDDDSVSRMHAVIEVSGPDDISIIDLGSTKGTMVNGQRVNKAKLQEGDEIVLGDLRIELSLKSAVDSAGAEFDASDDEKTKVNVSSAAPAPHAPLPGAPPAPAQAPAAAASIPAPAAPPAASIPAPAAAAPAPAAFSAPAPRAAAAPPASGSAAAAFSGGESLGTSAIDDITGTSAVEVAAMLGESVVEVKHVLNPRGGKVTPVTYGLFAGGAFLLVLSLIAFVVGVRNSSANEVAKHDWTEVQKKPLGDYRDQRISLAWDWMAFGGAAGGLLCMIFGMARLRNEQVQPFFRIGRAAGVDFPTDDSPVEDFPLVAPMGDDFVFNFASSFEGEMMVDGQSTPLADLQASGVASASATAPGAMQVRIPHKGRFRVQTGSQTFLVSSVPPPRKHPVPLFATLETAPLAFLAGSAAVILGILALAFTVIPDRGSLNADLIGVDGRNSLVQSKPTEDPKQEEPESDKGDDDDSGGTGTKMALDEGKMGKKESTRAAGQYAMKNNQVDPQLAKQAAQDQARKAGILGALRLQPGGAFASLTGTGDFSSGLDDRDVYGGLLGNEVGEMAGGWGYGVSGVGPGGGGTGWGTIGTGRYGTIGHGSGTGDGYGSGSGRGGMRGRKARPPSVRIGNATATGDLDKNIIRRYIRRQLRRITNCYERQLLVKPTLSGTITTQFQISPSGSVQGASARGMGSKAVESCVAGVIRSIRFPKPKGGGFVNVRYPFTFRTGGN